MKLKDFKMRRKDREMDKEFAYYIIDRAEFGVLSVKDGDHIYSIPLSIVRDGKRLYFHSGKKGRKVGLFNEDTYAFIVFVADVQVPENYSKEELDQISQDSSKAMKHISSIFTTEFASAMVEGKIKMVKRDEEKIHGLKLICEKYTPSKMDFFDIAIKASLDRVNIYYLEIDQMTSKRKKYNQEGIEMKFMADK